MGKGEYMKNNAVKALLIIILAWCSIGLVYAQADTATVENAQTRQMLMQLRQLQARQRQQLQRGSTTGIGQASLSGHLHASVNDKQTTRDRRPPYASRFQFPYSEAQIRHSRELQQISHEAFKKAVNTVLPMTPQQIHRLKQIYSAAQFAAAAPAGIPPKPTATSLYVNLSPGAVPPAIRLSEGFVSSLVFLDSTGAPWPIASYDLGNPNAFNIAWDKKDNVLMIQAKTLYTYGNLAVRLRDLNTPVMLTLIPGQKVVDYRVDITVPGYGPDAKALAIDTGLPSQITPVLLNVLDGIPPTGSEQLTVAGYAGKAWLLGGKMYLRTHYTLLSPGWLAAMASADGTHAYELQKTPMLLLARNGKVVHVKIGGL